MGKKKQLTTDRILEDLEREYEAAWASTWGSPDFVTQMVKDHLHQHNREVLLETVGLEKSADRIVARYRSPLSEELKSLTTQVARAWIRSEFTNEKLALTKKQKHDLVRLYRDTLAENAEIIISRCAREHAKRIIVEHFGEPTFDAAAARRDLEDLAARANAFLPVIDKIRKTPVSLPYVSEGEPEGE